MLSLNIEELQRCDTCKTSSNSSHTEIGILIMLFGISYNTDKYLFKARLC